jgi:DNA-binding response OmpR family regulator
MIFSFGQYKLDVERRELRQGGDAIHLEPQVFDLLVYLVKNPLVIARNSSFLYKGAAIPDQRAEDLRDNGRGEYPV